MIAYADTSLLVSLYVLDANSTRAATQIKKITFPIFLTPFGEVELANAIYLRVFRKELAPQDAMTAQDLFAKLRFLKRPAWSDSEIILWKDSHHYPAR